MSSAPTDLDYIASIIVIIIMVISALTLFGMGILMAVSAVFSHRPLVTSWPPEQEHTFSSFERRASTSNSQAWVFGLAGAVLLGVFAIGVYAAVPPDKKDIAKDMNMSNLTKRRAVTTPAPKAEPAAPTPAPAEAPKTDTPAPEAPKQ